MIYSITIMVTGGGGAGGLKQDQRKNVNENKICAMDCKSKIIPVVNMRGIPRTDISYVTNFASSAEERVIYTLSGYFSDRCSANPVPSVRPGSLFKRNPWYWYR